MKKASHDCSLNLFLPFLPHQTVGELVEYVRAAAMDDIFVCFPGKATSGEEEIYKVVYLPVHETANLSDIEGVDFKPLSLSMTPGAFITNADNF